MENRKYTDESIDDLDYRNLFLEITKCGKRDWGKKNGKKVPDLNHPTYSSYARLDFTHLYTYLVIQVGDDKAKFQLMIDDTAIQWATFYRGQHRNIEPDKVKIGICTAAEFLKIPLITLLAEFLEDCESKKIRLFSYVNYEKIIKSFLRDAPNLVEQLQPKTSQFLAQDNLEQSTEQIVAENRHGIERVTGKTKWLDPYNHDELRLVGRKKEFGQLNKFVEHADQFKIWAIVGPSGAGKTRLASQWALDSPSLIGWDCHVLHKEDRTKPEKWANWLPDKSTLIIIDYIYGFDEVVLKLMGRRLNPTESKVRILLLDHVFSEPLHSDERWGFSGDGSSLNRNEKHFFALKPLDLRRTQKQETIIKSIIADRVGIDIESNKIDESHKFLLKIKGAYHPLFAALVGDAIKSGEDFTVWNRRALIDYYLSGEKRLPWKHEDFALTGRWASHFIAVATARRGMNYRNLIEATRNCASVPEHFGDTKEICQKIIADDNATTLAPFEPDILGESFFLEFLKFLEGSNKYQEEFRQVFMAGKEDTQTEDSVAFIAFIQRLTRNLLNDDQSQSETQELWQTLFNFMCPSEFINAKPIRWALSAGLIDIVDATKERLSEEKLITLLNRIEPTVFYQVNNPVLLEKAVLYSMRCFELTSKLTKKNLVLPDEMFALFDRHTASNANRVTPLIFASFYGFNKVINALIDRGVNTDARLISGLNALMFASFLGQIESVKQLLNAGGNIHATDDEGHTVLMWASIGGHVDMTKLLLDNGAEIGAIDNGGQTAFLRASLKGHVEVVKLLLNEGAEIDIADNEGQTAFHKASINGHVEVVKLLLNEGKDIDIADNENCTALILASATGHVEMAKLLLDEGAEINAVDNDGYTALILASATGHVEVAKLLLEEKANIHVTNNKGHTALIWASIKGHIEVVKFLLDEGANIHTIDNVGRNALMWASINGHIEMARLLLGKGTNINVANYDGYTALALACIKGHVEVAKLLLDEKRNIHATDDEAYTALTLASINGHVEVVKLLLDEKRNIHATNDKGHTALIWASATVHIDVVRLLLDEGANIHAADSIGRTALIWASIKGHVDVVKLLLDEGANIHAANDNGHTALIWGSFSGHVEVVKLLLDEGANIHTADNIGRTALILASLKGHVEVVKLLLRRKARVDVIDNHRQTALSVATAKGYKEIIELLVERGAKI